MAIHVPYLPEDEIERDAELLLAEYEETAGAPPKLPIPIEEITIYHLALRFEIVDLHEMLGIRMKRGQPDILGMILMDSERVLIDQRLDPKRYPSMQGRYRFSVGHEIGHWRLHRSYAVRDANQTSFLDAPSEPTVICRSSQAKASIEWQADYFASCILMPRQMVLDEWVSRFGSVDGMVVIGEDLPNPAQSDWQALVPDRFSNLSLVELDDYVVAPFSESFKVSKQAMRIRLEGLGLLLQEFPQQTRLAGLA